MKEINISNKIFLFRFGLIILALLALHVFFTIYKQLDQASQVLNKLAEAGMVPIGYEEDKLNKQPKYFSLPNYAGSKHVTKSPIRKRERFLEVNPQSRGQNGRNFRTRFRESVFSYERRFYESDHTVSPTYLMEMNRSPRTQKAGKYQYGRNVKKAEHIKNNNNHNNKSKNKANKSMKETTTNNNNRNNNNEKKVKTMKHVSGAKVMILAYRRSGSSFIGEMFNRNPRVFYLFEPVYPVEKIAGRGKYPLLYDTLVSHLFDVIYTCSFDKHPFLVNFLSRSAFRLKSEVLRSSGLCAVNATPQITLLECKPLNETILNSLCSSKDHIVVKSIRTSGKKTFEYFAGSQTQDLRSYKLNLIHLVRDPRAIISSRLQIYIRDKINSTKVQLRDDQNLTNALRRSVRVASANLCSRIQSDLKYGKQAGPNLYMLLRYEDAAMRPLKIYRQVSQFVGIKESEFVKDWLKRNTKFAHKDNDEYSTSQNSTASVNEWRRKLPFKLVTEVQSQCAEVMKMLGYLPTRSERELMDIENL